MNLIDYPRPGGDTGWGLHTSAGFSHPLGTDEANYRQGPDGRWGEFASEIIASGHRWLKLGDFDGSAYNVLKFFCEPAGLEPIVRMYRPQPNPGSLTDRQKEVLRGYRFGVKDSEGKWLALPVRLFYVEPNNEPNLAAEWKDGLMPPLREAAQVYADNWIADADFLQSLGYIPGFGSLSPTDGSFDTRAAMRARGFQRPNYNMPLFFELALLRIKQRGRLDIFERGAFVATHDAMLNHPPEYPYVQAEQTEHPGSSIYRHWDPSTGLPTGASNSWLGFLALREIFVTITGNENVPFLGTEGGVWVGSRQDSRFPEITPELQADYTLTVRRWVRNGRIPDWYFCTGDWLYLNRVAGNLAPEFERDAWRRVPGYGTCPSWEPARLPVIDRQIAEPNSVRAPFTSLPVPAQLPGGAMLPAQLRDEAWRAQGAELHPTWALQRKAKELSLGAPLGPEHRIEMNGVVWVWQAYASGIVGTEEGNWENIRPLDWFPG